MTDNTNLADDLRNLAAFFDTSDIKRPSTLDVSIYSFDEDETPNLVRRIAKKLGTYTKSHVGNFTLTKHFGRIKLRYVFLANAVCTSHVVGTKVIEIEAREASTHTEDIVEWDCPTLSEPAS